MKLRMTVIVLMLALLPAGYALGQAIFGIFSGTEAAAPGPPLEFGTISCSGGEPTGLWPNGPPCTAGTRIVRLRGMKLLYHVQATDSRFTGEQVVVVNGDFEGWREVDPASGVMWGTLRLEVTGKGLGPIQGIKTGEVWEGAFTGTRMITAGVVRSSFHDVAYGSGGRVEGMHADWHVSLNPVTGVGECQGRILAPAGQ